MNHTPRHGLLVDNSRTAGGMLTHHTAAHQSLGSMQGRTEHEVSMHSSRLLPACAASDCPAHA